MKQVVQLCYDESLLLLADEVYQANIFDKENKPFVSFKKVLREMEKEVAEGVELVSFHSISKGVSGECGRRGGYFEAVNLDAGVMEQIYKMASVNLCPPITGQVSYSPFAFFPSFFASSLVSSSIHDHVACHDKSSNPLSIDIYSARVREWYTLAANRTHLYSEAVVPR